MNALKISEINFNNLNIAKSYNNYKLVYDYKNNGEYNTLQLHTPLMHSIYKPTSIKKDWTPICEYSVDCVVDSEFKTFMTQLDTYIINTLKTKFQLDTNEYNSILKKNGDLLKLRYIRDKLGNFETHVFNSNNENLSINEMNIEEIIPVYSYFKCIIECSKIWVYSGKIGTIWSIIQQKMITTGKSSEYSQYMFDT